MKVLSVKNLLQSSAIKTATAALALTFISSVSFANSDWEVSEWKVIKRSSVLDSTSYNCDEGTDGTAVTYSDVLVAENVKAALQVTCRGSLLGAGVMEVYINSYNPRSANWISSATSGRTYKMYMQKRGDCQKYLNQFDSVTSQNPLIIKVNQQSRTFSF